MVFFLYQNYTVLNPCHATSVSVKVKKLSEWIRNGSMTKPEHELSIVEQSADQCFLYLFMYLIILNSLRIEKNMQSLSITWDNEIFTQTYCIVTDILSLKNGYRVNEYDTVNKLKSDYIKLLLF